MADDVAGPGLSAALDTYASRSGRIADQKSLQQEGRKVSDEMQGIEAVKVLSTGTAPNGMAYVECEFGDGSRGGIFFTQERAQDLCVAFLSAASRLEREAPRPGGIVTATPLREAELFPAETSDEGSVFVMTLTTVDGSPLSFMLSAKAGEGLVAQVRRMGRLMATPQFLN